MKINIRPLSINACWQGRRFRTPEYKAYQEELSYLLPKLKIDRNCKLRLTLIVGFSNKLSDIDNVIKPIQDIMQAKFGFNDHQIHELNVTKEIVKKGEEFIDFEFEII